MRTITHNPIASISFILLCCFTFENNIIAQTQLGSDLDGDAAGDLAGTIVHMPDATTMAFGAPRNDDGGSDAGHVQVYDWDGTTWNQLGTSIEGQLSDDEFGTSISMGDNHTIAVGAPYYDAFGTDAGMVAVYAWNGSAWVQKGSFIGGESAGDEAGFAVSMPDSNTVAVGSHFNSDNGSLSGQVEVYAWDGSAWVQKGVDLEGAAAGDEFGRSVDMSDSNTLLIGSPYADANGTNSGSAYVYTWNGSSWVQKGTTINGEATGDFSSWSVSLADSNTMAIGAPDNSGNGSQSGHVRIFEWSGSAWSQKGIDIDGEASNDNAGRSVSMPGPNTVGIGASGNDGGGLSSGHARVYQWDGSLWAQIGTDIDGEASFDQSGWTVSMGDTLTIAIGARLNDGAGTNAGHVRVYEMPDPCPATDTTLFVAACESYIWAQTGETLTTTGTYADTTLNAAGCDSIITLDLTINQPTSSQQTASACESYLWSVSGLSYSSSGSYSFDTINAVGCDSTIILDLTIYNSTESTETVIECSESYQWPQTGEVYSATGIYSDTLLTTNGCDSILLLDLSLVEIDTSVTQVNPEPSVVALSANFIADGYRWLNCNENYAFIAGEVGQTFTPEEDGSYAVELTVDGCVDTSSCHVITSLGIGNTDGSSVRVFPNPTDGMVYIQTGNTAVSHTYTIHNALGERILEGSFNTDLKRLDLPSVAGLYFLTIESDQGRLQRFSVVKH